MAFKVFNNGISVAALLVHDTAVRALLLGGLEQSVDVRCVGAGSAADKDDGSRVRRVASARQNFAEFIGTLNSFR